MDTSVRPKLIQIYRVPKTRRRTEALCYLLGLRSCPHMPSMLVAATFLQKLSAETVSRMKPSSNLGVDICFADCVSVGLAERERKREI